MESAPLFFPTCTRIGVFYSQKSGKNPYHFRKIGAVEKMCLTPGKPEYALIFAQNNRIRLTPVFGRA